MNVFNANLCQETLRSYLGYDCVVSRDFAWFCMVLNGFAYMCMVLPVLRGFFEIWFKMFLYVPNSSYEWFGMVPRGFVWFCIVVCG